MDDPQLVYEALRRGLITPEEGRKRLAIPEKIGRPEDYATQAGVGVVKAGAGLLGTPGDVASLGGAKGTRGPYGPTDRSVQPHLPTTEDVRNYFGELTGKSLPEPAYPESKYISAATQGMASGLSRAPGALASGALSGLLGEASEQMAKGTRAVGNIAGYIPAIASKFIKPWDVKTIAPYIERIGRDKVNLANVDATNAANVLGTDTTNIAHQLPQLRPTMSWLQGTQHGKPLADLAATERSALMSSDLVPNENWKPHTAQNLWNMLIRQPIRDPLPGLPRAIEEGSKRTTADWARAVIPSRFWTERLGEARSDVRLSDLAKTLASPDAGDYLLGLTKHSSVKDVADQVAKSLLSTQIQSGGNQPQ